MKKLILIIITTLCLSLIVACGALDREVNLEKNGKKYSTEQGVSFYYPNDFEINLDSKDNSTVKFSKDNNMLYFTVLKDESDNVLEDKDELYTGELEQGGASSIEVSRPVLDSGLSVYQYIFTYSDTVIKAMEIVYFGDNNTYIYGYCATKDDYDANEKDMRVYLQSFSKSTGK